MPIEIETFGTYGPQAFKLIKQIGKKIQEATSEKQFTLTHANYLNENPKRQCCLH